MQKNNPKTLTVDCVNRVKYERPTEFEESLFEDVYRNACRLVKKIIRDNESLKENIPDPEYSTDEQCSNVITFFGGRGMGKSSAMLSFALFLKDYEAGVKSGFNIDTSKTMPVFSVLPRIDVAMMVKGENIMDIILAKMWDAFEKRSETTHKREIYLEEMKDDFKKVKKSYEIYKKTLAEKEVIQNMTSIREMHELAVCLNLRDDFKKLVENYLGFVLADKACRDEGRFLVISIDDLDMVMRDIYNILEQVRLFLLIPRVIVLITADLDRLSMACNKQFAEALINRDIFENYEKQQVREYVANYLAKLFPGNMRVFMPKIGSLAGVECELIEDTEHYDEKKYMLVLMAKYSNIFCDPYSKKKYFLQKDTLRNIVNNLYLLRDISKQDSKEWFDLVCRWYFMELSEYCKGIEDTELRQDLQDLLEIYSGDSDKTYLNMLVRKGLIQAMTGDKGFVQTITSDKESSDYKLIKGIGYDYGDILVLLSMVQNQEKVFNFISLAYSVQIARLKKKGEEDIYIGNKIFNSFLARQNISNRNGMEKVHSLGNMLDIVLEDTVSEDNKDTEEKNHVRQVFNNNRKRIIETFKIAYLCNVNVWDSEKPGYVEWICTKMGERGTTKVIEQTVADIKDTDLGTVKIFCSMNHVSMRRVPVSMDALFFNAPLYEDYVRGFVYNLYNGLSKCCNEVKCQEDVIEQVKQIINDPAWHMEEYWEWKNKYGIHTVMDVLPFESVGLMYFLTKDIMNSIRSEQWSLMKEGCTVDILQRRLDLLCQALEQIEGYYECKMLCYHKYSEIISKYLEVIQIVNLSDDNKKKLDIPELMFTSTPAV